MAFTAARELLAPLHDPAVGRELPQQAFQLRVPETDLAQKGCSPVQGRQVVDPLAVGILGVPGWVPGRLS